MKVMRPQAIYMLFVRFTSKLIQRFVPTAIAELLVTVFGLWALITPLILWISWSAEVLAFALFTGIAAILLAGIFAIAVAPDDIETDAVDRIEKPQVNTEQPTKRSRLPTWRDSA